MSDAFVLTRRFASLASSHFTQCYVIVCAFLLVWLYVVVCLLWMSLSDWLTINIFMFCNFFLFIASNPQICYLSNHSNGVMMMMMVHTSYHQPINQPPPTTDQLNRIVKIANWRPLKNKWINIVMFSIKWSRNCQRVQPIYKIAINALRNKAITKLAKPWRSHRKSYQPICHCIMFY